MNRKPLYLSLVAGVLSLLAGHSSFAQGTAFLYQGQLGNGGSPANGSYDFQFTVYNAITNGQAVSSTVTNTGVAVNNGLFTATLDFGAGIFNGTTNVWLNIGVRTNNTAAFAFLSPRQPILATPYAIFANSASNLVGVLPASQLSGTLPASAFTGYTNSVALTNGANLFSGAFSGNGGSVTNVNVSNLAGILAASQLPTNTAYVNSNNTFTASNTFTGNNTFNGANVFTNLTGNSFSGSFFGNGLVGWVVVPGTTVQASIDHGYLLTNQQVDTVTLPPTANVGDIVRIAGAGSTGWQVAQNAGQSVLGNFITYGKVWTLTSQNGEWDSMASSSDGTRMILGNMNSGTFISVNSGASWGNVFSTEVQVVGVASSADGTHLACVVTNGGEIYVSVNSGSTWAPLGAANWTAVASSSSGNQFVAVAANQGIATFSTTAGINNYANAISWSSVASSANGSNLVASAYNGSIYLSVNAGASWNPSSSGVKNWKAVASSADGTKLVAAVYGGGIYSSINSGGSWSPTLAPAENWVSLASSSDGSRLIAVANGGGVFTSANWGTTWLLQTNTVPTTTTWGCCASSASGSTLATAINFPASGGIYTSQAAAQTSTTAGTTGYISGSQGSAAELQCIGNGQFMPISSVGTIWGN